MRPSTPCKPDALALERKDAAQGQAWLEAQFCRERSATFEARVFEEHARLVRIFAGPAGLKPSAWPRLPHQLALVAERNVRRQDKTDKERQEIEVWGAPDVIDAAIRQAKAGGYEAGIDDTVSPRRPSTSSARRSSTAWLRTETMNSKQHRTALDVIGRMAAGKLRAKYRRSSTGQSLDEMDYERVRNVATKFKKNTERLAALKGVEQTAPQRASLSPRSFNFGDHPRQKAQANVDQAKDGIGKGSEELPAPGGLHQDARPFSSPKGLGSETQSSRGSHAGSRKSLGFRTRKIEDMGPLAIAYQRAAKTAGTSCNQAIAEALCDSDPSNELTITGAVLNALASKALAEALASCHHLISMQFSRTVFNQAALEILLPVARTLKLKSLLIICSNLTPECCPILVSAFSRPTQSLSNPPSVWWLSLQKVDLGGNPLGDHGFTALLPVLPQLQGLRSLNLRQVGLTDWSSPQVEQLLRTMGQLASLDLGQNQLGPMVGKAIAASLAACSQLEFFDLSWNPLGSSVQHIGWALVAPRFKGCYKLKSLLLAGCDLEAEDIMALAVFLRFGMPNVPLEKLDLSHVALVGVEAQCLLRQLHQLLPPLPAQPDPEPAEPATPDTTSQAVKKGMATTATKATVPCQQQKKSPASAPVPAVTPAAAAATTGYRERSRSSPPKRHKPRTEQELLEFEFQEAQAREAQPPRLTQVTLMGCRVELDGGIAPKARIKANMFPPNIPLASNSTGSQRRPSTVSKSWGGPLDMHARKKLSCGRSGEDPPPLQYYRLNLAVERPDRIIAQMLVEQELDARLNRIMCWYGMVLEGRVIRKNGRDVVPFDVLYEGWHCEGAIPDSGILELEVACLPEKASPWWLNPRLQFNAAQLLKKKEEEARAKSRARVLGPE